ncbi:MAG: FAD-dependent oxidoreductase [Alphaproteobacteria bacterium]
MPIRSISLKACRLAIRGKILLLLAQNMKTDDCYVIAGGGLAGLFAAKTLRASGVKNIYIIEKSDGVDGLLSSRSVSYDGAEYSFDAGTHFILSTNDPDIDALMQQDLDGLDLREYRGSLFEGHAANGRLYQESGCVNLGLFSADVQNAVRAELEALTSSSSSDVSEQGKPSNLFEAFVSRYGRSAAAHIYGSIFEKITGQDAKMVAPEMEVLFVPPRLIIADREESVALKKKPEWDDRIAFADCLDGTSDVVKYYPKTGGIHEWPKVMAANLEREGVQILNNCSIQKVNAEGKVIRSVTLSNGEEIRCDHVVWTLPPALFGFCSDVELPMKRPVMRSVGVVNILTDRRPVERPYWINIYDPDFQTFRVTLYGNFAPRQPHNGVYKITAEIINDGGFEGSEEEQKLVFEELQKLSILPEDAQLLYSEANQKAEGFPVLTPDLLETSRQQVALLEEGFDNLILAGGLPDKGYGQVAAMRTAYFAIQESLKI